RRSPRLRRPRRHWRRTPGQCRTLEHDATVSHGLRRRVAERSTRRMNVAIVDYGTGNLHSLAKALQASGASVHIEQDLDAVARADAIVLPGVGAFGAAAARLSLGSTQLKHTLAAGRPCLGICLGMQLLFEASE